MTNDYSESSTLEDAEEIESLFISEVIRDDYDLLMIDQLLKEAFSEK